MAAREPSDVIHNKHGDRGRAKENGSELKEKKKCKRSDAEMCTINVIITWVKKKERTQNDVK